MPSINIGLLRSLARTQEKYADVLARQIAERRLDEVEARIASTQQARGYRPMTDDTGRVIRWVDCNPVGPREEYP
jgi:Zn-dependent protease with chaperone function